MPDESLISLPVGQLAASTLCVVLSDRPLSFFRRRPLSLRLLHFCYIVNKNPYFIHASVLPLP